MKIGLSEQDSFFKEAQGELLAGSAHRTSAVPYPLTPLPPYPLPAYPHTATCESDFLGVH